ncbi:hypothetical protein PsorP6_007605 [Peronosclerospora sorghi]|uniref:Uncharacterized protein n=1 Tax=Peronosclerospora sorghi TaxID=230839 RepID=A0ACC0W824_9STRA|nr:hypothetical protein PsorP6_007605 [Peronosclerospora sorghi]
MAEKRAGDCKLYDQMVEKIEEPYLQEDDTADIALLSEGEQLVFSRPRACTTSSLSTSSRLSNILNPLSRLAMRRKD